MPNPTGKRSPRDFLHTRPQGLPNDWQFVKVGEIAQEMNERNSGGDDIPVLSCTKHVGLVDSLEYFGKQVFSEDTSSYKVVRKGQFAYATNHIEEGSIGLLTHRAIGLVSPMYTVFMPDEERAYGPFLYAVLKTELYRHIFEINTNASVDRRGSLRWHQFAEIRVPLPGRPEQERIAGVLRVAEREVSLLESRLALARKQKTGLMQKLLTGQIRVKGGEDVA